MIKRKFMYAFILLSLSIVLVVNYYSSLESLWMLILIPAVTTVILCPTWKAAITVGFSSFILMVITEFVFHRVQPSFRDAVHLMITGAVEWIIFMTASFFQIRTAKMIAELGNLALTDPLTKIYNRRYLDLNLEKSSLFPNKEQSMTLILFDIDYFKAINDTFGHNAGDMVLKKVCRVVKEIIRESDIFVRTGGEEFLIFLQDCSLEQGIKLAERIRKTVEETDFVYKDKRIYVTISVGVSKYSKEKDLKEFTEKADQALYQAKETGRNKVVVI
ncbi:GGDEF domain-containing protein [Bacillus smithii]|uniref:GGDEF domain-containing protein n=1 Tax=Bacillus smithii TaxID=1479 RepID=UPI00065E4910|nr:GGDEF domain-containing protein [Bacillus smithii]AKP45624.1 putative sensory transduction protein [Bacillus smithii]